MIKHERALGSQPLSMGAAMLRVVITLLIFLGFFISFLMAPLITLGIGYLIYRANRARGSRTKAAKPALARAQVASPSGFGAGAS